MKGSEIKILLVMKEKITALEYWRQHIPHYRLTTTHPVKVEVEFTRDEDTKQGKPPLCNLPDSDLATYDIVCFLRTIDTYGRTQAILDRCRRNDVKTILDIDDYWELDKSHYHYATYKAHNIPGYTVEAIRGVDHVTTTTSTFASIISEYNANVTVLPNCISPDDPQFLTRTIDSPRLRFGWIGGVFHKHDAYLMYYSIKEMASLQRSELAAGVQICLGGFNDGNTPKQIIVENRQKFRKLASDTNNYKIPEQEKNLIRKGINVLQPEYLQMEQIFTDNYKSVSADYKRYLFQFTPAMEHCSFDEPYRRLWAMDIYNYGDLYNQIDVALIPLRDSSFNACKSELKIIEAGWMGKGAIVSDVMPYKPFLKNEVNCIAVNPNRNPTDWFIAMRKLATEPNLRADISNGLRETIREHFDIDRHNSTRLDLYKHLASNPVTA